MHQADPRRSKLRQHTLTPLQAGLLAPCLTTTHGIILWRTIVRYLTLAIEDKLFEAASRLAIEQGTTLDQLVRNHLAGLVAGRRRAAAERLNRAMREELVEVGPLTWLREDLYRS
jgi:hypothetical protein